MMALIRVCIGLLALIKALSSPVMGIDLFELVNSGLQNNYALRVSRENLIASQLQVRENQGRFTPTLSLSEVHTETEQTSPIWSYAIVREYSASVTQPLYDPALSRDYEESLLKKSISKLEFREIKEKAVLDIMSIVFGICKMLSQHAITANSVESVKKNVDIQQKLLAASYGSRIGILEAEVELARYRKEFQDIGSKVELELLNLSQLTNKPVTIDQFPSYKTLSSMQLEKNFPRDVPFWIEAAHKNNTRLALVKVNQKLGKLNKTRGYDTLKPRMDLSYTLSEINDNSVSTGIEHEQSVKLSLTLSFAPVNAYYQLKRLDVELASLYLEEKKVIDDLENRINQLLETLTIQEKNMERQKEWISKQEELIGLYQKGLDRKHFPISRILDLSRKYNESQLDLVNLLIENWETRLQLYHLAGLLDKKAIVYFDGLLN